MKRIALLMALLSIVCCRKPEKPLMTGDVNRGRQLIDQYGCAACHRIPGISGSSGMTGPALTHIGSRPLIANKYPNTPENLMRWLQNPQALDPGNSMPNLGISATDSRDIAAFLFSIK